MGIGPIGMKQGDRIAVLFGGEVPFVIGNRGYGDLLVGACFVQGIMHGEAARACENNRKKSEVFHLH